MMMHKVTACVFALSLGLGSTVHAAAATTTRYSFKGSSAFASVDADDAGGCIRAGLYVYASEETTKDVAGNRTTTRSAFISYGGSDDCMLLSFGGGGQVTFSAPIGAQTFTLPFDITVDFAETDVPDNEDGERFSRRLVGSVTLNATGDLEKSRETNITKNETQRVVVRSKGTTREADVTVNAKLDGVKVKFLPGTGSLGTTKQATVEVTKF